MYYNASTPNFDCTPIGNLLYLYYAYILSGSCGADGPTRCRHRFRIPGAAKTFWKYFRLTAGAVLGIVLIMMMHLYTEAGYVTILVMWGGFFLISAIERLTTHRRDETEGNVNSRWGINLTVFGLSIHSLADGLNLVIAAREEMIGGALAFGILIHRLPVGTLITVALLRNQTFAKALLRLTPLIIGPVVGALIGEQLFRGAFQELTHYLTAFAVGTLLHVVMDGFRGNYTVESASLSRIAKALFVIGFVLTFCAIYFLQGFEGEHAH